MRISVQSHLFTVSKSDTVQQLCAKLREIPKEITDITVDVDQLFAGRTMIECVQIQMVMVETNLTRTVNGSHQLLVDQSSADGIWQADYLRELMAKEDPGSPNGRIAEQVKTLYRRAKINVDGCCFAISDLAIKAHSADELSRFIDRVHALNCIEPLRLSLFLADLKKLIARYVDFEKGLGESPFAKYELSIVRVRLQQLRDFHTNLWGFFDGVVLMQVPERFPQVILGSDNKHDDRLRQSERPAAAITRPIAVAENKQAVKFADRVDMYRQTHFAEHLRVLVESLVVDNDDDFSVAIGIYKHEIALHYSAANDRWLLQDPNALPGQVFMNTYAGRLVLAATLYRQIKAFAGDGVVCFESHLYAKSKKAKALASRMPLYDKFIQSSDIAAVDRVEMRAGKDVFGETLLSYASVTGSVVACQKAIAAGADLYATAYETGKKPLTLARENGFNIIARLIQGALIACRPKPPKPLRKIRLDEPSGPRELPESIEPPKLCHTLLYACRVGDVDAVARFIDKGDNIEELGYGGETPLLLACRLNHLQIVKLLLAVGANVEAVRQSDAYRPIHVACQNANANLVGILLKAGADKHAKAKIKSPASIAKHHSAIAKLLKEHQARKPFQSSSGLSLFKAMPTYDARKATNRTVLSVLPSHTPLSC
ncbi:MAG: ankyrin repeat domain-containing protein [Coxiellaceae bacterium]|nr:ankyrin repeat domain-containing protein [Coxiellaceae bacterium]